MNATTINGRPISAEMAAARALACDTASWPESMIDLTDMSQERCEKLAALNAPYEPFNRSDRATVMARVTIDGTASTLPMAAALKLARGARANGCSVCVRLAK